VTLGLPVVLQWALPAAFARVVLAQRIVIVPTSDIGAQLVPQFSTWQADLASGGSLEALAREVEAFLIRILQAHERLGPRDCVPSVETVTGAHGSRIAAMARFIAEHFRDPIGTTEVAQAVGLSPGYATTLFRE